MPIVVMVLALFLAIPAGLFVSSQLLALQGDAAALTGALPGLFAAIPVMAYILTGFVGIVTAGLAISVLANRTVR